tara:strand:- start:141 stop:515 length:375 start_codon:yes stop_codon:yes gene_type:complete
MPVRKGSTFISPVTVSLLANVPVMMTNDFDTSMIAEKIQIEKQNNRVGFTDFTRIPNGERHNMYTTRMHHGIVDSRASLPDAFGKFKRVEARNEMKLMFNLTREQTKDTIPSDNTQPNKPPDMF